MSKNQQINYTTKPIELPLSTEKEYVLVDEKGYLEKCSGVYTTELLKPFKLTSVDSDGDGKIWSEWVIQHALRNDNQCKYFHEVIRQPQPNEFNTDSIAVTEQEEEEFNAMANNSEIPNSSEWKNGDECVYMNHKVIQKFVGFCPKREGYCYIQAPTFEINFVEVSKLSKPETEAERNERERLEAAYDLYCEGQHAVGVTGYRSFERFNTDNVQVNFYLAIVDKTNYRLTK